MSLNVTNTTANTLITGTADSDLIINLADDVTIDSGGGNDTIYSGLDGKAAHRASINAGAGDNIISIQASSDSVTILTGDGNNLIGSTSPNNAVFSGAGNDFVVFYTGADNNTVSTGDGDDSINAVGHNVTIDADGDEMPDGISIGNIIYVPQSGVHTNINHLSGNVIYNGDALGVEGDDDYNIEAISPIDTSEKWPYGYITDPNVTAIRNISDGATISPRTQETADWISFDTVGGSVTFKDGSYCLYTDDKFSSRDYTKLSIANGNKGVVVNSGDSLIKSIGNLQNGYEITIESGINVGEKINFSTAGSGVIVVKTTANTGKYSLDADSNEWQYQSYSIGGDNEFTFVFGENGSVVGMEDFDGMLQTNDRTLFKSEWVTLSSGRFEYTGNATNNPSKWASFTVSGDSITSTDNLKIANQVYIPTDDAIRFAVSGLNDNASIDDIELGVSGDSMYAVHFTKGTNDIKNIVLTNISDGATVDNNYPSGVDDDAAIKFSDGLHTIFTNDKLTVQDFTTIEADNGDEGFSLNVSGGTFDEISGLNNGYGISVTTSGNVGKELAFETDGGAGTVAIQYGDTSEEFNLSGDTSFAVKFNSKKNSVSLVDYEGWIKLEDGSFEYRSAATNNPAETATLTISGDSIVDSDNDAVPDGVSINSFNYVEDIGIMAAVDGLSGEATLNGKSIGVKGDDNYDVHFTAKLEKNPTPQAGAYAKTKELLNISDGATVNANANDSISVDENAEIYLGDVENVYIYTADKTKTQVGLKNPKAAKSSLLCKIPS